MAAAEHLTWDGVAGDDPQLPRRPSTDDLGGDELVDDQNNKPVDGVHPTSAAWNQKVKQTVAMSKTTSPCIISVAFNGAGAPFIVRIASPRSDITPLTFTPTDNGNGDTTIEWPANTFPPRLVEPYGLTINDLVDIDRACIGMISGNGVRVITKLGATGTNAAFTFCLG